MSRSLANGRTRRWRRARALIAVISAAVLSGCATSGLSPEQAGRATEGYTGVKDLYIVNCLLPGQVRQLGTMTYLTPRRPIRTTAQNCRIRGGEYVAYDRADYRSALNVWLPRAKAGSAKAQTYVGEIFEKGLGRKPNYEAAAYWYRKAAKQGYARAQINLGYFYEMGLGVEQDYATALNWYRRAAGLSGDKLIYQSQMEQAVEELRAKLQRKLEKTAAQVAALRSQIERLKEQRANLKQQLRQAKERADSAAQHRQLQEKLATARQQITALTQLVASTTSRRQKLEEKLTELPKTRSVEPLPESHDVTVAANDPVTWQNINFGSYYALIIGNEDYRYLGDLETPLNDARRIQQILEQRYGFSTILVSNADKKAILAALNELYYRLGPEDNLLIYYAGHGSLRKQERRRRGYWLPVNARRGSLVNWLSNSVISAHLDRIRARAILVLADSCYAGALASKDSALLLGSTQGRLSERAIRAGLQHQARLVISSGGVEPVLDSAPGGNHSLFAGALIDVLKSADHVLDDNMLFARVAVKVRRRAEAIGVEQTPEMRPIRAAGHAGGDFYFVPQTSAL